MAIQILKTIAAGILAGLALYMVPFLIVKIIFFFLLIKGVFYLLGGRRRYGWRYAYAERWKNMNEDERKEYMQKYGNRWGCCGSWDETCDRDKANKV